MLSNKPFRTVNDLENKEKFTKTNLVLGFIIIDLILLIVGIFTWKLYTYKEVIDQMSLVASISSILLALVAIVYAFFQTFSSSKQGEQLQNTLSNIDKKINELNEIKDEFGVIKDEFGLFRETSTNDKMELLKVITDMDSKMQGSIESVFNTLKEKQIEVPDELKKDIMTEVTQQYIDSKKDVDTDWEKVRNNIGYMKKRFDLNLKHGSQFMKILNEGDEVTTHMMRNYLVSIGRDDVSNMEINLLMNTLVSNGFLYKKNRSYYRTHFLTDQK
jgi:hypothetical protein